METEKTSTRGGQFPHVHSVHARLVIGRQSRLAVNRGRRYFPIMIEALEIERMSRTEKLQAMELLWRSMAGTPEKLESPTWHKTILQKRLAKVEAGQGEFLTVAQLKKRLARRAA